MRLLKKVILPQERVTDPVICAVVLANCARSAAPRAWRDQLAAYIAKSNCVFVGAGITVG